MFRLTFSSDMEFLLLSSFIALFWNLRTSDFQIIEKSRGCCGGTENIYVNFDMDAFGIQRAGEVVVRSKRIFINMYCILHCRDHIL